MESLSTTTPTTTPPHGVPGNRAGSGPPAAHLGHPQAGGPTPTWLWASLGAQDEPPDRVQVFDCPTCGALVPLPSRSRHTAWHRRLDGV